MNQLTRYEELSKEIAEIRTLDEAKDMHDKIEALRIYYRNSGDIEAEVNMAEHKIRNFRRMGEISSELEKAPSGWAATSLPTEGKSKTETLADNKITTSVANRAEQVSRIEEAVFESRLAEHREKQTPVTQKSILNNTVAQRHTGDEESYTPSKYLESARAVMGDFDLDPASNEQAQQTVQAKKYLTIDDNGLEQDWTGVVWLNPPYTALVINEFVDKLVWHYESGDVSQAILLTNNNTDTSWFHNAAWVAGAICFTKGRINFLKKDGSLSSPTNGQSFFYFGDRVAEFVAEFRTHGLVVEKA